MGELRPRTGLPSLLPDAVSELKHFLQTFLEQALNIQNLWTFYPESAVNKEQKTKASTKQVYNKCVGAEPNERK